jgi:hypothetical protein
MLMKIPGIFKQAGSSRCELVKELVPLEAAEPDMCTTSCAGLPQGKKNLLLRQITIEQTLHSDYSANDNNV